MPCRTRSADIGSAPQKAPQAVARPGDPGLRRYQRSESPFADAAAVWEPHGYTVVPSLDEKKPAVKWGEFSLYAKGVHRPPTPEEISAWKTRFASADRGCLILDSRATLPLVVVDIDNEDEALLDWVIKAFGETPLIVRSGRGWHLYYRAPFGRKVTSRNGFIGPTTSFGDGLVSPIDVKASGAYAIASGSWHDGRGRPYEASQPITEELLQSLPIFDDARYEQTCKRTKSLRDIDATPEDLRRDGADMLLKAASRRQQERRAKAAREGRPSLVLTEAIPTDTVVKMESGGSRTLGDLISGGVFGRKFHCPWHEGGSASANLFETDHDVRLHCHSSRCEGGRTAVVAQVVEAVEPVTIVETPIDRALAESAQSGADGLLSLDTADEAPAQGQAAVGAQAPVSAPAEGRITFDLSGARLVVRGEDAIEPEPNAYGRRDVRSTAIDEAVAAGARYIFEKVPTSGGKSKSIGKYHERMDDDPCICAPTLRRSLATTAAENWGLFDYQQADGRALDHHEARRISICADSLVRLERHLMVDGEPLVYRTLILDESESLAPHLHASTMSGHRSLAVYNTLRSIVRGHSETVIIADATMSDLSIAWMAQLSGLTVDELIAESAFIIDDRPRAEMSPMQVIRFEPGEGDDLIAARHLVQSGRPLRFFCESKEDAKAIHRELAEMDQMLGRDRAFLLITADADPEKDAFLADPNEWIRMHRDHGEGIGAIIHTTAMESGLSLHEPMSADGGDIVLARVGGRVVTWPQVVQAMSRSRGAEVWAIDCPDEGMPGETDPAVIKRALREGRHHTDLIMFRAIRDNLGSIHRHPLDPEHLESYAHTRAHRVKTRASIGADLFRYLASEGYECRSPQHVAADRDRAASIKSLLEARGLVKAEDIADVVAAGDGGLGALAARDILESASPERGRWLEARHAVLHHFYERDVTAGLVEWDNDGQGRGRVDAYVDTLAALEGRLGEVALRDMTGDRVVTAGAKFRCARAEIRADMLRTIGVTPEILTGAAEGESVQMKMDGEKRQVRVHVAVLDARWRCSLAGWLSSPVVRRAIRGVCGVDPWRCLGQFGRRLIETENAFGHDALRAGQGVPGQGVPSIYTSAPLGQLKNHQIGTLYNRLLASIGVATRTRRKRVEGVKVPHLFMLLETAAKTRSLSDAQWERCYGIPQPYVDSPAQFAASMARWQTPESRDVAPWPKPPESLLRCRESQS